MSAAADHLSLNSTISVIVCLTVFGDWVVALQEIIGR